MAEKNYTNIDRPFDGNMDRGNEFGEVETSVKVVKEDIINNPAQISDNVLGNKSFEDIWIENWIKSNNYSPKTSGFYLDGRNGRIECSQFYVGNDLNHLSFENNSISLVCSGENAITIEYGSDILLKDGGDIKFTSVTAPTACTAALVEAAGNVDAGVHSYKITYVNEAGETELGTISNEVTNDGTHEQNALTGIPTSTSNSVTSRKIYRTDAGGSFYYLLATISDNTTTTYTDNIADASLAAHRADFIKNTSFGKIFVDGNPVLSLDFWSSKVGYNSLAANTTGYRNTGIGAQTLSSNTRGYRNTAIGNVSLSSNTEGLLNTAVGQATLYSNTTGNYNTAIGANCLPDNINGDYNTAIGLQALHDNTEGKGNSSIGFDALYTNTTGDYNTGLGYKALLSVSTGDKNIGIGWYAGAYETGSNAFYVNNQDRTNTAGDKSLSLLYGVMAAAAADQKLTINGLLNLSVSKTPSSAADTGTAGDIAWDASYIYVCTTTNTWKRVAVATW